jgi:lipid-A-disaccharide synthase
VTTPAPAPTFFLVAAEESGDRLGADLMRALRARLGDDVRFEGLGGRGMAEQGLRSLFAIEQLSIVGLGGIVSRLPTLLRLIRQAADAAVQSPARMLIIIDSPEFSQRVARQVRRKRPAMPIVNYVSPSVWAWRQGRARAMRPYIDHILALLPFEPEALRRLGGPPTTYVGHPLRAQLAELRPSPAEQERRGSAPPLLVVLPGSRGSEVRRHMPIFGETLARLAARGVDFELVLPTVPHLEEAVRNEARNWSVAARIVCGDADKRAAFRCARAALAKSGTVTLELALAGIPMVAAYRMGWLEGKVARLLVKGQSAILANLVLGENVVAEYLLDDCTADNLTPALLEVLREGPARQRQLDAFATLDRVMATGSSTPSERAADVVLEVLKQKGGA